MALQSSKKEMFFSQLHSLLTAGLDFNRSFEMLISGEKEKKLTFILKKLYADVVNGLTLWKALQESKEFSPLDCGVIRIGEETGRLAETLAFLTDYYHKNMEQRRMITSAVSYPFIILGTAVIVLTFMLLVIVPMFEQIYTRMGSELPALTQSIIVFSKKLPLFFAVLTLLTVSAGILLYATKEKESTQRNVAGVLLRIPIIGGIIRYNCQCNFCKLLYLLTSSGVPLLHGIKLLEEVITFYPYRNSFHEICVLLERGELFTTGLALHPHIYNRKLITLLRVGEETNKLPFMLQKQGNELTVELEYKLKSLGTMLEPILIICIGIMVAVILISMYLPMFKLGGVI